jgi:hypothetical protein
MWFPYANEQLPWQAVNKNFSKHNISVKNRTHCEAHFLILKEPSGISAF